MNFFDTRCSSQINAVADIAVDVVNDIIRNNARPRYDLAEICLWSAQDVAPEVGLERQVEMAEVARGRVLEVIENLRFTVCV